MCTSRGAHNAADEPVVSASNMRRASLLTRKNVAGMMVPLACRPSASRPRHTIQFASDEPAFGVPRYSLSDINGPEWKRLPNDYGEYPDVNYAFCEPMELFTTGTSRYLLEAARRHYGTDREYSTARTSACLRGVSEINEVLRDAPCRARLEQIVSGLVGVPMRMHPSHLETAHINVQKDVQDGPVDKWHHDSTPFVLVTLLTGATPLPLSLLSNSSQPPRDRSIP